MGKVVADLIAEAVHGMPIEPPTGELTMDTLAIQMTDEPNNIILELLRAIPGDIAEIKTDIVEVKERLGLLESQYASISRRLDRQGGDVERIKQRLDLVDVP